MKTEYRYILMAQKLTMTLYSCSFFTICPAAKVVFGFPIDVSPQVLVRDHGKRFIKHASVLIQMIEAAINMLGPDIDMLSEIMTDLGPKHVTWGVTPDMFPALGQCLIDTIAECLNDIEPGSFPSSIRDAWDEVYVNLSTDIMKAYDAKKAKRSASQTK